MRGQEDCIRVIACLGADSERIIRLARIKPLLKAFCNALQVGSAKTIDTALWLAWRMTIDDDFCARLFRNTELVRPPLGWIRQQFRACSRALCSI